MGIKPRTGNLRYLFGQDFMNYIAEKLQPSVDRVEPHLWWRHSLLAAGKESPRQTPPEFYTEWKASMEDRYAKQIPEIEAIGVTEYTLLSDEGRNCAFAHYAPDGSKMNYPVFTGEWVFCIHRGPKWQ